MKLKFLFSVVSICILTSCEEETYPLTVLVEDAYTKKQITEANIAFDSQTKTRSDEDGTFRLDAIAEGNYLLVCSKEGYLKCDTIIDIPYQRNLKIKLQPLITLIAKPSYLDFGKNYSEQYFTINNPYDDAPVKNFKISSSSNWINISPTSVDVVRQGNQTIKVTVDRSKMPDKISEGRLTINMEPNIAKNTIPTVTVKAEK